MTLRDYTANVISASKVVPDGNFKDSKASGVWDINEALDLIKGGNWPNAANINPAAFVDGLFQTHLYIGAGGTTVTVDNGIDLLNKGGLVWIKARNATEDHGLFDTTRGVTKLLSSNNTNAEATNSGTLTNFYNDGFKVDGNGIVGSSTDPYVSWTFRKQPKFFDVLTYTGNGSARTISHNLGSVPGMIIIKKTSGTANWMVYHRGANGGTNPEQYYAKLNDTDAFSTLASAWNNTAPTSSVFTLGDQINVNENGATYVAYLFAHNADSTDSAQTSLQGKTLSNLGSAFDSSYPITEINDGVAETSNANSIGYVSNADMDISVDYGSAVVANAYYIAPQGDQGGSVYNTPTAFTAYGSNNGSSWTSLASFSSISGFAAGSFKEFTFSNTTAYRYYRLEITASSASGVSISEWELGLAPDASEIGNFGEAGDSNIIKCDSYTGNGSSTGPVVNLGFEPQFIMIKRASGGTGDWDVYDNMRGIPMGAGEQRLEWNTSDADSTAGADRINLSSTGFSIATTNSNVNTNGDTYIYMAIRRGGMQTPTAASDVFAISTNGQAGDSTAPAYRSTFPVDMFLETTTGGSSWYISSRLTGNKYVKTDSTAAEVADSNLDFDYMNGVYTSTGSNSAYHGWMWKRVSSYFDVVAYKSTTSAQTLNHNLSAIPEMMWIKNRDDTKDWQVYHSALGNTKYLQLNASDAEATASNRWNDTSPTATQFTVGTAQKVNDVTTTRNYIAYLFATVAGVSKVGSYTGNGTSQTIDCGFTNGAKFVLVKQSSSTGSWFVFDTVRGINSGNDNLLQINATGGEYTGADYIDPDSSGFIAVGDNNNMNTNGQTFIFYAIAA